MKVAKYFISIVLASLISACSTNAPLETLHYQGNHTSSQKKLIIFLRGRGGNHEDFAAEGFIDDIKARELPFDMAAPNAHFGYYFGETLVPRLKADVIEQAKADGYEKFWLVGVSMGGLGALMYTRFHPDDIEGICLISPFLGYKKIIKEIEAAGGLKKWEPGKYNPEKDWQRMFWDWLKQNAENEKLMSRIYLGYGTDDSLMPAHLLLGEILPKDNVFTTSGGHTREAMKRVWRIFLEKNVLE